MTNYIILLPPSEGKNKGGTQELKLSFSELKPYREQVLADLKETIKKSDEKDLMKIFKIKNLEDIKSFEYNKNKCLTSINRFSGVMFKSIVYDSLINKTNFDKSVIFVDALFGLLKPKDFIFDYKLMMGTKLKRYRTDKFWKNILILNKFNFFKNKLVIDLLPNAHKSSVDFKGLNIFSINFFEKVGNNLKNVGHKSKKLKGEFIRFICLKENINLEYIKSFEHSEGYKFCKNSSDLKSNILCFVK